MSFEPIAIVGQGCLLPGALSPDALWQAVVAGRDLLSTTPAGRWRVDPARLRVAPGADREGCWSDRGGYVQGFERVFDPAGFALPPEHLLGLDPVVLWLLHVARAALRDAGLEGGPRVGAVFGNLSFPSASLARLAEREWLGPALADRVGVAATDPRNRFMSGLPVHLLARALRLGGRSWALDAACASSLYAIKLACDQLHDGSADLMLAGAVNCADDLFIHVGFAALKALSLSGQSRPFHRDADGLVPAEGAAALVLRRLDDAERAGQRILGVIRGVGLSNDGRGLGLLVPDESGQVRAMRAAYACAGREPGQVSLVECHATGTLVGDSAEVRSLARVFAGVADLPIGSLKSNLGHSITAAGAAGLIKVLGALAHRQRPPSLHADEPLPILDGTALRVLRQAEPWPSDGPRLAAVSAFGFGGNNAHLLVEEHVPRARPAAVAPRPTPASCTTAVAVVGMGARVGAGVGVAELAAALFVADARPTTCADQIELPLAGSRFPPRDLEQTLPQQLAMLATAREALADLRPVATERAGVVVGMGCDAEVARYGARWRAAEWAETLGVHDPAWAQELASSFTAPLQAAGVLGTMPNVVANRLNVQYDLQGQSFTVAAEELSGLRALQLAVRSLRAGELDLVLAGAVDYAREQVNQAALRSLGLTRPPGDAAVMLALKRAADAHRDGDRIWALVDVDADAAERLDGDRVAARLGYAHAASGLVQVASAVLCCATATRPDGQPWPGPRSLRVEVEALGSARDVVTVSGDGEPIRLASLASRAESCRSYPAHLPVPSPPRLPRVADVERFATSPVHRMALAPTLARVTEAPERAPDVVESGARAPGLASLWRHQHRALARAHTQFVADQGITHERFLRLRQDLTGALPTSPAPVPALPTTERVAAALAHQRPGPQLDRQDLEIHASGTISSLFGPLFAQQDGFRRQVRMPRPPLLLADRVTGLDAEPGSMGVGTVWTETDVHDDAWYLHDGRMPAGLMIEAGQADLLLISYLGADFLNRGERVYRLLGCDLTFHGPLASPGETLCYDIHVDGHATQGAVRLFFFHYDCQVAGALRLSVRGGQAGFFTDDELDRSMGVLWDARGGEHSPEPRLDPPAVACQRRRLDRGQLEALAAGRADQCFGPGFELAASHTRTPRIAGDRMLLLDQITDLDVDGGPWGRGYLRAVTRPTPEAWFFDGHFHQDPCMPGTLMLEGCLQAMAVYLAGLGYTLPRDGWRFEPVPDATYKLRCRGQATPRSRELVYELFVDELEAGPLPTLWADLLCTVDGLKAFHCRRMGLRLVPGWPLDSAPAPAAPSTDDGPVASHDGFAFNQRSLLACATGQPSQAFGPMYRRFDGPGRVARLPGPPYHFMSRVRRVDGEMGAMQVGSALLSEYHVPADAWYFTENAAPVMPFAVLLEIALQPCGWLASYVGSALVADAELCFRNLDGKGRVLGEVRPDGGVLRIRSTLTSVSRTEDMIIESFEVQCHARERLLYELTTVFGYFPAEALTQQVGLPVPEHEQGALQRASDERVELRDHDGPWPASGPALAAPMLRMLHRVTGVWLDGGRAGLGRFRAELDVDPAAWFFKAHFFQDPVQPGSLGLEAMLQLLQFAMLRLGMAEGPWASGRFEPVAVDERHAWKYRGQVVPRDRRMVVLLDVVRRETQPTGPLAVAEASLWVDGRRIYEAQGLAMRIVRDDRATTARPRSSPAPTGADDGASDEILDPERAPWLRDHCPTFTVPALPLMAMVDRLARAAVRVRPGQVVVAVEEAQALRWLTLARPTRLSTRVRPLDEHSVEVTLLACEEPPAGTAPVADPLPVASGRVVLAPAFPSSTPAPWPQPVDAQAVPDPYAAGELFHGPALQLLRSLAVGATGSIASLDAAAGSWPRGLLHASLLDALTHGTPHHALHRWHPDIPQGQVAFPQRVIALRRYAEPPQQGEVECVTRFTGFDEDPRFVQLAIQARAGGRVILELELVEILFPKGPLGLLPPLQRRAFLRDCAVVPGAGLSRVDGARTRLHPAELRASDWLPGTIAHLYAVQDQDPVTEVAVKDHVARLAGVHPSTVQVNADASLARPASQPLSAYPVAVARDHDERVVHSPAPPHLDLEPVRTFWDAHFKLGRWPVEDLYYGLAERFVRSVQVQEPQAHRALQGRSVLYLANHQVGIESLLFSVLASGLGGIVTRTLAKIEHRTTWLGLLIQHAFAYPGARDPGVISYFDRQAQDQLPVVVAELAEVMRAHQASVLVHIEGTRSLRCRQPVQKMSGAFVDMALALQTAVVPVRFVGGLPVDAAARRLEFPEGLGQQDFWIGAPIEARELAALNYKQRKDRVLAAINALGPAVDEETPIAGDAGLQRAAQAWVEHSGASFEHAVLLEVLRGLRAPCDEVAALLAAATCGHLVVANDPRGRWLAELARRLFGPRGPAVHCH